MTLNDKLAIQRALGIIEGVAWGADDTAAAALGAAVEMIDEVINKENSKNE